MLLRRLLLVLRFGLPAGLLVGGLYGAAISLLHVVHNRLDRPADALLTLFWLGLLYALLAAPFFLGGVLLFETVTHLRSTPEADESGSNPRPGFGAQLAGLLLFNLVFWEAVVLYGLTYDQTVIFHPGTALGMSLYLALSGLLVGLVVAAGSAAVLTLWQVLVEPGRRRWLWGSAAAVVALHLVLPGLIGRAAQTPSSGQDVGGAEARPFKVAVIGFDGLDPFVVERGIAEGLLPTFERLMREGASGELATLPDANSSVLWASLYTGHRPHEHGILDFYRLRLPGMSRGLFPVHRTYFKEAADRLTRFGLVDRDIVSRVDLTRAPLWEVADHAGLSIGVVDGYFYSFPALEPSNEQGFVLSYGADGYARQLEAGTMGLDELRLFVAPKEVFPEVGALLDQDDFTWQSSSLLRLLEARGQPSLLNLYTHEPDSVQHQAWREYQPEKYFGARPAAGTPLILETHRRFDSFLAQLLERLEPGTALVVVSDHGHSPTLVHALDTQHRHGPPGVLLLHGAPFRAGATLDDAHVYDVFPTLLHLLGLAVPEDVPGRVLTEAFSSVFETTAVRTVPSYGWLGALGPTGPGRSDVLDAQEIEKLKALGYL